MTERSYVYDGFLVGDATIAPYSSAEWSELQRNLASAARNDYGVLAGTGNGTQLALEVQATGPASATVNMYAGAAIVNGRLYINDATLNLAIGANVSGNSRIDTVIIRRDTVAQTARAAVKQGSPAATPVPATLQQDATTWEIPVAYITVANGFSVINQHDIANCGQVVGGNAQQYIDDVLNNSGGRLETGMVVSWDTTTPRAVIQPTIQNDPFSAGTWVGSTANGARGRVQTDGIGWIRVATSALYDYSIGDGLVSSSSVVGDAEPARLNMKRVAYGLGRSLEAVPAVGTVTSLILAYIQVQSHHAQYSRAQDFTNVASGLNTGAWTQRTISSLISVLPGITLASNILNVAKNVPVAFHWVLAGYKIGTWSSRLFDITNSISYFGSVGVSPAAAAVQTWGEGWAEVAGFGAVGTTQYRIEQQCSVTNTTDGFGIAPPAWHGSQPYLTVEIWRGWS